MSVNCLFYFLLSGYVSHINLINHIYIILLFRSCVSLFLSILFINLTTHFYLGYFFIILVFFVALVTTSTLLLNQKVVNCSWLI
jgi:hypothetical protein